MAAVLNLQIGTRAIAGRFKNRRGQNVARFEDIAGEDLSVISGISPATSSAICVLCELPTTHSTPGISASSSGARWA